MKTFTSPLGINVTLINASGSAIKRPAIVTDRHLAYLDRLQKSGVTNMFGAGEYIRQSFNVTRSEASTILAYWMQSYDERHPE